MLQQSIQNRVQKITNFLGFTKNYLRRKNPIKAFLLQVENTIKEILLMGRKKKMAHYRLSYQMHKLNEMEQLIASSNEHTFLKGQKFNTMR